MNKLLTKIVGLSLGLSMAIGVGIAVATVQGGSVKSVEASSTGSDTVTYSELGIGNQTSVAGTSYTVGDYFSVVITKESASTNPTYYDSGAAVRCYATKSTNTGNKITITRTAAGSTNSAYITSVTYNGTHSKKGTTSFTYTAAKENGTSVSASSSTATSATYTEANAVVTASAQVCETGGSANGQFYLTSVTVAYAYTAPTTPTLSLDKNSITIGKGQTGTFTVTTTALTNTFTVSSADTNYVTVDSISPAASSADGTYTVTLSGVEVTASAINVTVASTGAVSQTIAVSVEQLPLIDTNLSALSWDANSYATSPHVLTMNSTYTWGVSAGQYNSSIGYLGANSSNSKYITVDGSDWTMTGSDYSSIQSVMATGDGSSSYWSTYGSAFRMLNFGVVHPSSFVVNAGTVGSSSVKKYFIFASADSGETWELLANGDIAASTDMGWDNASKYASESKPIQFAFVYTTGAVNTISNVSVKVYADSYVTTKVLDSIYISGTPKTTYVVGEVFDLNGAKVYARYTDSATYPDEDISSSVSWTAITHGLTEVVGSYGGKSTSSVSVTVSDEGTVYKKVLSTDELIEGAKVIIGTSDGAYTAGNQGATNKNRTPEAAGGAYGYYDDGDIENWSINTTVFTVGLTENGYTFHDGNGYIYAASNSDNILRVEAELDENHNAEWSVTITDGVSTIVSQGSYSHNTLNGNGTAFSAYSEPTVGISLYADVAGTVQAFIDANMHTDIPYDPDPDLPINNTKDCLNSDWYVDAKKVLVALGDAYIDEFQSNGSFANALARYNAWALACGDTTPFEGVGIVSSGSSIFGMSDSQINQTTAIIVVVSVLSVSAIGGFFFLRKRKEQ